MKLIAIALAASLAAMGAASAADTCMTKAIDKNGKPLAGAAKTAFMKRCTADAKADCETKAVDKNGKALAGAAKTASVKKCVADEVGK